MECEAKETIKIDFADRTDIFFRNFRAPIALFLEFEITTRSRKRLERISYAHIVGLVYKQLS